MLTFSFSALYFRLIYCCQLFGIGLSGPLLPPERRPELLWPRDAARGRLVMERQFRFHNVTVPFTENGWEAAGNPPLRWWAALYRFGWIGDVMAFSNTRLSAGRIREYLLPWLQGEPLHAIALDENVTGERLANLSATLMFLLAGAGVRFRRRLLRAMARDALRLRRQLRLQAAGMGLQGLKGLVAIACALPTAQFFLADVEKALSRILAREMAADGSHHSRCPRLQVEFLRHLLEMQAILQRMGRPVWPGLIQSANAAAGALGLFRHGDGGLALFNDTLATGTEKLHAMLTRVAAASPVPENLKNGFYRLARGTSLVVLDAGAPNLQEATTHFGTLSFEFSTGRQRIVTNCGAYRGRLKTGNASAARHRRIRPWSLTAWIPIRGHPFPCTASHPSLKRPMASASIARLWRRAIPAIRMRSGWCISAAWC